MENKVFKLKINNKNKHLEKYIKPQWTWRTYLFLTLLTVALAYTIIDLEINFIELFTDSSRYFGDILGRMLPPDFSNLSNLIRAMFETIEIAFLGTFIAIVLSIPVGLFSARNLAPNYLVFLIARIITWHIPVSFLFAVGSLYTVASLLGSNMSLPVLPALLSGGIMLGAFFIATDPVSAAASRQGPHYQTVAG